MHVVLYFRRPQQGTFSIERLFADVCRALQGVVDTRVAVSRFASTGIWRRVYNIIEAAFRQAEVNHITGDVHFLTLLLRKNRTLLTICDLVALHRLRGLRRAVVFFFWYWLPVRRAALISVISESTKRELLSHLNLAPDRVRVVHCPVSDAFQPAAGNFNAARPVILQIGITDNKNIERVAEALAGIPCHFRIIGVLNDKQKAALREHGVDYSAAAGLTDEKIIDEYRRCDMLVFASTYEGFGMPILEAQATGRPVVTGAVTSMPEVAGDAACLVDPFAVASIRAGILKVIRDPQYRDGLVQRGFENVKRFRPAMIAGQYLQLYRELLER